MKPENYQKYRFFMKIWHGYLLPLLLLGVITVIVVMFYKDVNNLRDRQEHYVTEHSTPQEQKMDEIEKKLDLILQHMEEDDGDNTEANS